jgi:hypothetical protein
VSAFKKAAHQVGGGRLGSAQGAHRQGHARAVTIQLASVPPSRRSTRSPPPNLTPVPRTPARRAMAGGRRPGAAAGRAKRGRVTRTYTTEEGEVLAAGEDYYIELDSFDYEVHAEDEEEPCELCGRAELLGGLLECGQCLRGFHLRCLRPPLKRVPEGEWLCPQVRGSRAWRCGRAAMRRRCSASSPLPATPPPPPPTCGRNVERPAAAQLLGPCAPASHRRSLHSPAAPSPPTPSTAARSATPASRRRARRG